MRHKRIGRKLGVTTKHRKSMLRNMVTDLFRNDRLKTTDTRAKEIRRAAEKIITLAKEGTLHKRRQAAAYVKDKEVLQKLFGEIADKFKDRPGGYTRITKLGFRKGDNTPISIIELVEEEYKPKKKKRAKAAPKKKTTAKAKSDSAKAKSSKKESAEELGLIEEEGKAKETLAAEAAAVAGTAEAVVEETPAEVEAKEAPVEDTKAEAKEEVPGASEPVAESEPEEAPEPEAKAQEETPEEVAEEPAAENEDTTEAEPEPEIEAKADEASAEESQDSSDAEDEKEPEKKED